jgi:hypothetical protein
MREVEAVCRLYENAVELHQQGIHIVCVDEKTGIQALERVAPTKPLASTFVTRIEFEYIRHGTQCLTIHLLNRFVGLIVVVHSRSKLSYYFCRAALV